MQLIKRLEEVDPGILSLNIRGENIHACSKETILHLPAPCADIFLTVIPPMNATILTGTGEVTWFKTHVPVKWSFTVWEPYCQFIWYVLELTAEIPAEL